jgi:hypothetical protein
MLVLEAQDHLLRFLRGVVEKLVIGLEDGGASNTFMESMELGWKKTNKNSNVIEFASAYLNQPFSPPPVFEIGKLVSIAQSRLNLHGDHLWLLQTDPAYIRRQARVTLKGAIGEHIPKSFKDALVPQRMMRDCTNVWFWQGILEDVQKLEKAHFKSLETPNPAGKLLPSYERALASLEEVLNDQMRRRMDWLAFELPWRAGFSH